MAIIGRTTLNHIEILEFDADPSVSGVSAPVGSFGSYSNSEGGLFFKNGVGDTNWVKANTLSSVFGTERSYAESEGLSTTTSTSFVLKLNLTTSSLVGGTYRIEWQYAWYHTSTSNDFGARVQIDNTTTIHNHVEEPQDGGTDQRRSSSGFKEIALGAGVHSIDLDYLSGAGATAGIDQARLSIWRVA